MNEQRNMQREIKPETRQTSTAEADNAMNVPTVDFSRLYGDLCRKLLSTPMYDIIPEVVPKVSANHVTSATGSALSNNIHPAFPTYEAIASNQIQYLTNFYNPSGLLMTPSFVSSQQGSSKQEVLNCSYSLHSSDVSTKDNMKKSPLPVDGTGDCITDMSNIDIQKLVDEFRITLEQYGVSQRFAARFIMQDTSQGNLSYLMEKGRSKKWTELSPRGRVPYLKMKTWLENKDQQMKTLNMIKRYQDSRKSSPRETSNRREMFTMFQLNVLCRLFEENANPSMNVRSAVAERLCIPLERINVWFQNQRARGFPARKFLDSTHFENMNVNLDTDEETFKGERNLRHMQNSFNGGVDNWSHKVELAPTGSLESPGCQSTQSTVSPTFSSTEFVLKSEPVDTALPLDLSAASSCEITRSSKLHNPVTTQSADGHSYLTQNVDYSENAIRDRPSNSDYSQTKSAVSGAAKRKRGSKLQGRSTNKLKSNDISQPSEVEHETKRIKLEEIQMHEKNYTYLLDISEKSPETSVENESPISEYDYILKTESNDGPDDVRLVTNDTSINRNTETERTSLSNETTDGLVTITESVSSYNETNSLTGVSKRDFPSQSVTLFKAMCVSLAKTEENKTDIDIEEPELD